MSCIALVGRAKKHELSCGPSVPRRKLTWNNFKRILPMRGAQRGKGPRRLNFTWDEPLEGQGLVAERSHKQSARGEHCLSPSKRVITKPTKVT